jgi:hypothetical protein
MTLSLKSSFDRLPRRAILLGSEKLSVYHWLKGRVTDSYMFDTDETGQEQFERYLQQVPPSPVYILADFAEEEFRQETIPHVFGSDRRAIIQRKQNRLFRDATYCYSKVQGRETEGRRDDRILLTSITRPAQLKLWLSMLEKYHVPVASVTSVAIFSQELLPLLPEPGGNMLVVTLQSISGLRQSFFTDGELKISRSIKMPRYGTVSYAPFIAEEIEKIRRYLSSLRFVSSEEPLDIYFLTHGQLLSELDKDLEDSDVHRYHMLDLQELANAANMDVEITTPFSDRLLVHEVLRKRPENHYAKATDLRYFNMRKLRYGLYAASVLILISSIIYSGIALMKSIDYKQQSIAAAKKTGFYNERYQMAREGLPETPVEPRELQTLAKIEDELQKYRTTPLPMLRVISDGLNRFPGIILDGLEWAQSPDPNYRIGDSPATSTPAPSQLPPAPGLAIEEPGSNFYYQVALLNARIDNFDGNYRKAISTINSFAEVIRQQENVVNVTVTSLPLNISSDSSLQGNMAVTEKEALFSMKIALGVKADEQG